MSKHKANTTELHPKVRQTCNDLKLHFLFKLMKNWKSMPVLALYKRDTVMLQFNYLTRAKQGLGKQERDHRIGRDN